MAQRGPTPWPLLISFVRLSSMTSLLLGDLNDYIQPSVACIKPGVSSELEKIESHTDSKQEQAITVNLNDCLACSGCITSAESVLITEQTHQKLYSVLAANKTASLEQKKWVVISICAASRTALCKLFELSALSVWRRLVTFFREILSVELIFDTTFGAAFALHESAQEFVQRYREHVESKSNNKLMKPMLSSECPGWICFAEKRHPAMLGQICTVRSPQQIVGALIKTYLAELLNIDGSKIYHVSIQACYDKKLEASREDFTSPEPGPDGEKIRDVDCVIATTELLKMIEEKVPEGFTSLAEAKVGGISRDAFNTIFRCPVTGEYQMRRYPGSSAGGYIFYIMRYAAKELFGYDLCEDICLDPRIKITHHRSNVDFTEFTLTNNDNEEMLLRFAAIYGFKNIQTFVQKAKINRIDYHFIEVMACPGACLFGGGQPKILPGKQVQIEHRAGMECYYNQILAFTQEHHEHVQRVWSWLNAVPGRRQCLLHTQYRSLEEANNKPRINVFW